VSRGVDRRELAVLPRIPRAGGMEESELASLLRRIDGMLSSTIPPPA
jgi:hypothetical protein